MSNFDSDLFNCDPILFAAKNSPNSAKRNHIFPGNGRGDRALILTKLDGPIAEVFFGGVIVLFDLGHLQEETGCLKCKLWFRPKKILRKILKQRFCPQEYYL